MISLQTLLKLVFVVYLSCSKIEAGTNKYERVKIAQGFFNPIVGNPTKLSRIECAEFLRLTALRMKDVAEDAFPNSFRWRNDSSECVLGVAYTRMVNGDMVDSPNGEEVYVGHGIPPPEMTLLISGQAYNDPVLYGIPKSTIAIDRKDGIYCANHGVPDLVANVVYASTALVDNVIYFMGGKKNYVEDAVYTLDLKPSSSLWSWTTATRMKRKRAAFGTLEHQGRIYAFGGNPFNPSGQLESTIERYDPTGNTSALLPATIAIAGSTKVFRISQSRALVLMMNHRMQIFNLETETITDGNLQSLDSIWESPGFNYEPAGLAYMNGNSDPKVMVYGGGYNLWIMDAQDVTSKVNLTFDAIPGVVTSADSSVEFLNSAQSGDSVFLVKFNKLRDTDVHVLRLDPVSNQIELIKTNPYVTNAGMENRYCPGIISVPKMFFPNC